MPYIRPIVPTVDPVTGEAAVVSTLASAAASGLTNPTFAYHSYLERIANSLENLSECTYILAGVFTPVQDKGQLASVTGTLAGSVLTGLPEESVKLMVPGMVLTNLATGPESGKGWFGGYSKIATINSTTSITVTTQFPNNDGPITFCAGGYGSLVCTPTIPNVQADPRPGMMLVGPGILPGTFIIDYVVPGVSGAFYVSQPQKVTVKLFAAVSGLSAMAYSMNTMEAGISALANMANNQGIHTVDPYKLVEKATDYAYYSKNPAELQALVASLAKLPAELAQLKDILKGVTKLP